MIFDLLESHLSESDIHKDAHTLLLKEGCDDALILTKEHEDENKLIVRMTVLEPDASIAEFCGNGARVVACYLNHIFKHPSKEHYLATRVGSRKIWGDADSYFVDMGKTVFTRGANRFYDPKFDELVLGIGMRQFTFFWTETMEPHLVSFDDITEEELHDLGLYLNKKQRDFFPLGINLNKADLLSDTALHVITFERGVNRITAACGTGATSCAMLAKAFGLVKPGDPTQVLLKHGRITIHSHEDSSIMSGPATISIMPPANGRQSP